MARAGEVTFEFICDSFRTKTSTVSKYQVTCHHLGGSEWWVSIWGVAPCKIQLITVRLPGMNLCICEWSATAWNGSSCRPWLLHILYACLCTFHADMLFTIAPEIYRLVILVSWWEFTIYLRRSASSSAGPTALLHLVTDKPTAVPVDLFWQLLGSYWKSVEFCFFFFFLFKCCYVVTTRRGLGSSDVTHS